MDDKKDLARKQFFKCSCGHKHIDVCFNCGEYNGKYLPKKPKRGGSRK